MLHHTAERLWSPAFLWANPPGKRPQINQPNYWRLQNLICLFVSNFKLLDQTAKVPAKETCIPWKLSGFLFQLKSLKCLLRARMPHLACFVRCQSLGLDAQVPTQIQHQAPQHQKGTVMNDDEWALTKPWPQIIWTENPHTECGGPEVGPKHQMFLLNC